MAVFLSLLSPKPPQILDPTISKSAIVATPYSLTLNSSSKRHFFLKTASLCLISLTLKYPVADCLADTSPSLKPGLPSLANTTSWFQFYGSGFSIRVPPQFEDIMEPEDYNAGLSLYGDKVKPKTYAARFASPDGLEVLSVVTRSTNQLKITFLEAKDITDLGSLKDAAKIFIPGGSTIFSARTFKIKEEENTRTYYFYEFGNQEQRIALVAAVIGGKAIIAGATAPQSKWDDDGIKLRSAAISLTVL